MMRRMGLVAGLALVAAGVAWADVATPRPKWTTVRMAAEQVNITLGDAKVQVDATFEMQNLGAAATVQMGYPVGQFETALNAFAVTVDKQPVSGVRSQAGGSTPTMGRGGFGGGKPGAPAGRPPRLTASRGLTRSGRSSTCPSPSIRSGRST